jgi:hypothetical protein
MPGLEKFADNVWTVDGPPVRFVGLAFPTRMIIVRLADDSLWVNSPVVVPHEVLDQIKALGIVKYLVAPTKLHVCPARHPADFHEQKYRAPITRLR